MRCSLAGWWGLAGCLLWSAAVLADEAKPTEAAPPAPEAAQVREWIAALDSETFADREAATKRLAASGKAVVGPIVEAALGDNPEVSARVASILLELYRSPDSETADAAERGLEQLLASGQSAARRHAAAVLSFHQSIRQERALAAFEKLGGIVEYDQRFLAEDPDDEPQAKQAPQVQYLALTKQWKGGDQGLIYIKRLQPPREFALYITKGAPVSATALDDVQQALPMLKIQHRSEAYLGVGGGPDTEGCMITRVTEGSAAEKGGLRPGDVIKKFGDTPIKSFEEMIAAIRKYEGGDTVAIEFERDGEISATRVTLGEWTGLKSKPIKPQAPPQTEPKPE